MPESHSIPIWLMYASLAVGIVFLAAASRLPRGLAGSLFAFSATVAAGMLFYRLHCRASSVPLQLALLGALLTPIWTLIGTILSPRRTALAHDGAGPIEKRSNTGTAESVLAWAGLTGAATAACLAFLLIQLTWPRINEPMRTFAPSHSEGLFVFAGLLIAAVIWRVRGFSSQQPAVIFALAGLLAWWTSLMVPSGSLFDWVPAHLRLWFQPAWWTWTLQLQIGLTAVLLVAAFVQEAPYRRRRRLAWPDRLDDLLLPYARWPGYIQLEGFLASVVLVLGVFHIVRSGSGGWPLPALSAVSAFACGTGALFMAYRRWSANTAGLGMSLVSLGAVLAACAAGTLFGDQSEAGTYAERMPLIFNAALLGLVVMIFLWRWLADVWEQQLLEGTPWTTTGRMIPHARKMSFYLGTIAVLVAFQMALWPRRGLTPDEDNSIGRMIAGAFVLALLALQSAIAARRRGSVAWAGMSLVFVIMGAIFLYVRVPAPGIRGPVSQYEPIVLGLLAFPVLLAAEALPKTPWRSFSAPLWFLALLFLPLRTLIGLLPGTDLPHAWVRPVALTMLALIYGIAGRREHRRAFLVLGAVLLLAAGMEAYRLIDAGRSF
ncbi:MAG TPA: hypothetical protein VNT79_13425 [Phycisphaerae bacterium]|nr:hypothetical protein [Phycisphaerae bacterium]